MKTELNVVLQKQGHGDVLFDFDCRVLGIPDSVDLWVDRYSNYPPVASDCIAAGHLIKAGDVCRVVGDAGVHTISLERA